MTDHGKFRPLEEVATHSRSSASPEAMEPDAQYILLEHIVSGTGEVEPSTVAMHKIGSNKARYEASDVLYGKRPVTCFMGSSGPICGRCASQLNRATVPRTFFRFDRETSFPPTILLLS